jgi:phosphopantothenoylcysteine decarboxylase/phosphopantothenate--cysteine ligase
MGIAVAEEVMAAGGTPLLVLGPGTAAPPAGAMVVQARSAENMRDAVVKNLPCADALVMAAAVADYTPAGTLREKLRKKDGDFFLRLRRTPDILLEVAASGFRQGRFICGFSLDVAQNRGEALRKLREKDLDMIVSNTTDSFGTGEIRALLLFRDGEALDLGVVAKEALARVIVDRIRRFGAT